MGLPSTPDIADAHPDEVAALELPLASFGARPRFSGAVVTVKCFEDNSLVKELVSTPGGGRVIVVDGGGSRRRALLGDQLAAAAAGNGWAGLVIDGAVRDVDELRVTDLGIMALGATPLRTDKRGEGQLDIPVKIGGVEVRPGDYAYADGNGVLVSRRPLVEAE
jgi:regulator of ribonuclease activity A